MLRFVIILYVLTIVKCYPVNNCELKSYPSELFNYSSDPVVRKLQEYIRIDSSRVENYDLIVDFWRRQAAELGVAFAVYRPDSLPICVLTLKGRKPDLPSIMLNHHGDVVAGAYEDQWTYPPFSGHIDKNGDMFGRGTQDTKSVGIQYVEAVKRLVANNVTLERTLHITVMPDEETGGFRGIKAFIETADFKSLNIGFVLDEGLTSTDDVFLLAYQDKRPFQVRYNIVGPGGHGSSLTNGSTIEKVQHLIDAALKFRDQQTLVMKSTSKTDFGAYTTLNINMIQGGVAANIIPKEISVVIDIRLGTSANITDVQTMLDSWLAELGDESTMEFIRRDEFSPPTAVDDSNLYWVAMQDAFHNRGLTVLPVVLPATSDVLVLRARLRIPAFSFSPRINMKSKMHDVDEYIPVENFLKGVDIYYDLIKNLANIVMPTRTHFAVMEPASVRALTFLKGLFREPPLPVCEATDLRIVTLLTSK